MSIFINKMSVLKFESLSFTHAFCAIYLDANNTLTLIVGDQVKITYNS